MLRWFTKSKNASKIKETFEQSETHEHSVSPALDYPFATEFYPRSDSRYKLTETYKELLYRSKNIEVYNCKIEFPRLANDIYNVYIYINDINKTIREAYNPLLNKNRDLTALFYQALAECPIDELAGRKMNHNGVFVEDFIVRAKSYALANAFKTLDAALTRKYPQIQYLTYWNETVYIFFTNKSDIDLFLSRDNIDEFKKYAYTLVKPFDSDNVWTESPLAFMLDEYANYNSIGGHHYFNSDAMFSGVYI